MGKTEKLEELLPLYIGRKVLIDSGAHKLIGAEGTLVGKTLSRALVQYAGEILEVEFVDIKLLPIGQMPEEQNSDFVKLNHDGIFQLNQHEAESLIGKQIQSLVQNEYSIEIKFTNGSKLTIEGHTFPDSALSIYFKPTP